MVLKKPVTTSRLIGFLLAAAKAGIAALAGMPMAPKATATFMRTLEFSSSSALTIAWMASGISGLSLVMAKEASIRTFWFWSLSIISHNFAIVSGELSLILPTEITANLRVSSSW